MSDSFAKSVAQLNSHDFMDGIVTFIKLGFLWKKGLSFRNVDDKTFSSNGEFWKSVLQNKARGFDWIRLNNVQITDWYPRAPGLYHTSDAANFREEAEENVSKIDDILHYKPVGKGSMLKGGIGSVRFRPIKIEGRNCWLASATSDGYCHSGIPLAIPDEIVQRLGFDSRKLNSLIGQIRFIPEDVEQYYYNFHRVPFIYILVENIKQSKNTKSPVKITPSVFFKTKESEDEDAYPNGSDNLAVTYVTCEADSPNSLDYSQDFIEWYIDNYGQDVLTNFDQQMSMFSDAPFSLQKVMNGNPDLMKAKTVLPHYYVEEATIVCEAISNIFSEVTKMGDSVKVEFGDGTTIYGNVTTANTIKNSFNHADSSNASDEIKVLLKELAISVGKMSTELPDEEAKNVARDLETITAEATSESPRRRWWELSAEGLKEAAQSVGDIGKTVLDILPKLLPLLEKT